MKIRVLFEAKNITNDGHYKPSLNDLHKLFGDSGVLSDWVDGENNCVIEFDTEDRSAKVISMFLRA